MSDVFDTWDPEQMEYFIDRRANVASAGCWGVPRPLESAGSVILLPLLVFSQAYPLRFLEQFGPSWRLFSRRHRLFIEDEGFASETVPSHSGRRLAEMLARSF
jgi:hypothetical protein